MAAASNLVNFKRGTWANLKALIEDGTSGVDGCFYLSVDANTKSSRLYVGRADGSIVPVNQGITSVPNFNALLTGTWQAGDFAYIEDKNILAVYAGIGSETPHWIQLNQDKYIERLASAVSVTNGVATINVNGFYNYGGEEGVPDVTTSVTMTGTNGIDVSASGTEITIDGDKYNLAADASTSGQATINLTSTKNTGANDTTAHGSVTIKAGTNATLTTAQGGSEITIGALDKSITELKFTNGADSGFVLTGSKEYDNDLEATLDPEVTYGVNSTETKKFEGGKLVLDVYSKTEIDNIKKSLNAMTYRGTVGTGGSFGTDWTALSGNIAIGDTFKLVGISSTTKVELAAEYSATGSPVQIKTGDLLIVSGAVDKETHIPVNTEGPDGYVSGTIKFDVVPSGDDIDTTYSINNNQTHGIDIVNNVNGNPIGGIQLQQLGGTDGDYITMTDQTVTDDDGVSRKIVKLNHKNITQQQTTGTGMSNSGGATITGQVVTGLTFDDKGHVVGVEKSSLSVVSSASNITQFKAVGSVTNNVAKVENHIEVEDAASKVHSFYNGAKYTSDNLTLTASTISNEPFDYTDSNSNPVTGTASVPQISINFLWGSF